jgi:hypothetical protein
MTRMFVAAMGVLIVAMTHGAAAQPKAAVFDFELMDMSLESATQRPDEQERLKRAGEQLRQGLRESGKFAIVDIAPVRGEAVAANLQACGGCDVRFARRLGADLSVTGVVQKVSNLILNMNVYVHDAHTGQRVAAVSASFRGNTDQSWTRALDYLLRNRLLAPNYGAN